MTIFIHKSLPEPTSIFLVQIPLSKIISSLNVILFISLVILFISLDICLYIQIDFQYFLSLQLLSTYSVPGTF